MPSLKELFATNSIKTFNNLRDFKANTFLEVFPFKDITTVVKLEKKIANPEGKFASLSDHQLYYFNLKDLTDYDEYETFHSSDEVHLINSIVEGNLKVKKCKSIKFIKCVFFGNITVTECETVYFEDCLFFSMVQVIGVTNSFSFYKCTGKVLVLKIEENFLCSINSSFLLYFELSGLFSKNSRFTNNKFEYFASTNKVTNVTIFEFSQIQKIENIGKQPVFNNTFETELIKEVIQPSIPQESWDLEQMKYFSFQFLAQQSDLERKGREIISQFNHEWLISTQNGFSRFFLKITDSFNSPSYFIGYSFLTILIFGILYCLTDFGKDLSWQDPFYYSGFTFVTMGYGEVEPIDNLGKILSIVEGVLGVVFLSSYLVALVRKYVEK